MFISQLFLVYPPDGPDTEREVESGTEDDDEDDSDSDDDSNDENEAGAMIAPPASATPQSKTGSLSIQKFVVFIHLKKISDPNCPKC